MATEEIFVDCDAGTGASIRIGEPSTGKVFDFSVNAFVFLTGGSNEKLALTEVSPSNKGTGTSTYYGTFDPSRIHRGPIAKRYTIDVYATGTPNASTPPFASADQPIQLGRFGESPVQVPFSVTPMTTEGYSVQLTAACYCKDQAVDLFSGGKAAFTVTTGTDRINSNAHGMSNLEVVCFNTTGTLPTGLSPNTPYYVRNVLTNSYQVSLTPAGGIVDISTNGTGVHVWDNPTCVITLRELGASSVAFTTTLKLDSVRGKQFEGTYPAGKPVVFFDSLNFTSSSHGLATFDPVVIAGDPGSKLPSGFNDAQTYYAYVLVPNSFQLFYRKHGTGDTLVNFALDGTGTFKFFTGPQLLKPGKQYEAVATMTLSGQSLVVSRQIFGHREFAYPNSAMDLADIINGGGSTDLGTIIGNTTSIISTLNAGVKLASIQPNYAPSKPGDAMTLQTATKDDIVTRIDSGSTKLAAIFGKLPSRAYLAGSTLNTGQLPSTDFPPQGDKTFWLQSTPRISGLTPGQAYTWEFLSDNEAQIYATAGSPLGWLNISDPLFASRYTAGNLATVITATAGGVPEPVSIPGGAFLNGTKLRLRLRAGGSPATTDVEIQPRWRLARSTAEPVLSVDLNVLKQFVNTDTTLSVITHGSVCELAGGGVVRPATDLVLLDTTVQSVTDARTFVLVGGATSYDKSFEGCQVLLFDVSNGNAVSTDEVKRWTASSRTLAIQATPAFSVTAGDKVLIISSPGVRYQQTGPYVQR